MLAYFFKYTNNSDCDVKTTSKNETRFEFLDGFRGLLALIVVLTHAKVILNINDCLVLNKITCSVQGFAISGFFVLSAFLLTYRLLKDYHKVNNSSSNSSSLSLLTLHYFIRRFFRIYVAFAVYSIGAVWGPRFIAGYTYGTFTPLYILLALGYSGPNHLWTIAPEVKFYFFIPLFCLLFYSMRKWAPLLLIASAIWTGYDQVFNFFGVSSDDVFSTSNRCHELKNHFAVFFMGAQMGAWFFLAERSNRFEKLVRNSRVVQWTLNLVSIGVFAYALAFETDCITPKNGYT